MPIKTLDEKMAYELGGIYDAEHQFLEAQQQMIQQASDGTVKTLLQQHIQQTEQQIRNLEQVFQTLGQQPKREKCQAAAGLVSDGQKLLKEVSGNPALIDLAIAGAQAKVEHFEIACYRGLVTGAQQAGQQQIVQLLQQNLQQEEQTAQRVEASTPQLVQQALSSNQRGA
jgi:ferritin-like metal-binding protein YciE